MHIVKAVLLPCNSHIVIDIRIIGIRRLGDACKHCTFGNIELADGLSEVGFRSGFHAVAARAEVYRVKVRFKNILLGVILFKVESAQNLIELPDIGNVLLIRKVLYELLGDG